MIGGLPSAARGDGLAGSSAGSGQQAPREKDAELTLAARQHFDQALAHYDRGEFAQALAEFKVADRLFPHPDFQLNMARCEARLSRKAEARTHLRAFLAARPNDPDAPALRKELAELERALEAPPPGRVSRSGAAGRSTGAAAGTAAGGAGTAARGAGDVASRGGSAEGKRALPRYGLITAAGALAVTAAGAITLGVVRHGVDELGVSCAPECTPDQIDPLRGQAVAGYALLGVGAALAVAAAVVLPLELRRRAPDRVSAQLLLGPMTLGVRAAF